MAFEADCGSSTMLKAACVKSTVRFLVPGKYWTLCRWFRPGLFVVRASRPHGADSCQCAAETAAPQGSSGYVAVPLPLLRRADARLRAGGWELKTNPGGLSGRKIRNSKFEIRSF